MALTVTGFTADYLAMHATAGHATAVTGPKHGRWLRLEGDTVAAYWNLTGSDATAMGNDKNTIASGSYEWIYIDPAICGGLTPTVYLGCSGASGKVRVTFAMQRPA
jgi:hypothetical protein